MTAYAGLYCERGIERSIIQSSLSVGSVLGLFIMNIISDVKGRKFAFILALILAEMGVGSINNHLIFMYSVNYWGIFENCAIAINIANIMWDGWLFCHDYRLYSDFRPLPRETQKHGNYCDEWLLVNYLIMDCIGVLLKLVTVYSTMCYHNGIIIYY